MHVKAKVMCFVNCVFLKAEDKTSLGGCDGRGMFLWRRHCGANFNAIGAYLFSGTFFVQKKRSIILLYLAV